MTESSGFQGEARAGQEAARLLSAAQDWLRTAAPHLAPVDADGTTCTCPVCRAVAGVRDADPDVVGRWVDSAMAAATSVLSQAGERLVSTVDVDADAAAEDDDAAAADDAAAEDDDADGYLADVTGLDDVGDLDEDDVEPRVPEHGETAARQDEGSARGVRRIPLEQTEPGDLEG